MRSSKVLKFGASAVVAIFGFHFGSAPAATTSSTFQVSATVLKNCIIDTTSANVAFGNYDPGTGADYTASGTIKVTCTNTTGYTVALNGGTTSGGTIAQRKMAGAGGATLDYNLYSDSGYSTLWGDGAAGSTVGGTGNGAANSITVYAKAPKSQFVTPVAYSDTVTITVNF